MCELFQLLASVLSRRPSCQRPSELGAASAVTSARFRSDSIQITRRLREVRARSSPRTLVQVTRIRKQLRWQQLCLSCHFGSKLSRLNSAQLINQACDSARRVMELAFQQWNSFHIQFLPFSLCALDYTTNQLLLIGKGKATNECCRSISNI